MSKPFDQYIYVDGSWQLPGAIEKFTRWIRIQLSELDEKIRIPSNNHNCFSSIQHYRDAVSTRDREGANAQAEIGTEYQSHHCGLFFDFDSTRKGEESHAVAIARAQRDANKLVDYFTTLFEDINPAHIQCWFSGGKGFHVLIRPEIFSIKPHTHLTYMIKNMAWAVADNLEIPTLDRKVYSISRLWRVPNSVHQSTGLYKIELSINDLRSLSADEIIKIAQHPRSHPVWDAVEYESIPHITEATAWWDEWERYFEWQEQMYKNRPRKRVERPEGEEGLPACMQDLVDNGPKPDGRQRNHVAMVMATYWKDMGFSEEAANEEIERWTRDHFKDRSDRELRENIANGRSASKSVYSDNKYAFTCAAVRACGNTKGPNPVACSAPNCKWVPNAEDQEPEDIPLVHLSEASKGIYDGRRTRIPVHVSGKMESPYMLPLKGKVRCPANSEHRCQFCPFQEEDAGADNEVEWSLSAATRDVLSMIDVSDSQRKGAVKALMKFPKDCYRCKVTFEEMSNIEALRLIPMVDYDSAYQEDSINQDEVTAKSSEHAVRDGYFIGHGIQANKKYNLVAYTYSHPKDQRAVHVFEEAKPNQNDIEHFRLNEEMKERLKIFQVKPGQDVMSKMHEIHKDLCNNVHQIGGLPNLAHAADLCFHSVIGFNFMGKFVEKGWFELLVVGDSAMGKSTMVKRLMHHFRVGELLAGEEAKRSGLVWASIQVNGKWTLIWGKIPQNDRRLLVIDEFGEMDPDEVTKMTQLRSEGKAMGQGVSSEYETWARTRLIFLTNVRGSKDLSYYNYGIQAVASIFKAKADLRRTDLAVTIKKGEVPSNVVTKGYNDPENQVPHVYTSDLCHNLILWAWSRNPNHVAFVGGAEKKILELSRAIGERYNSDIYLVETNDMRHKLARVSCAVAARVFSTDERCIKVLVTEEHVEYAAALFDRCYGKSNHRSSMKYHQYAKQYQKRNQFDAERKEQFSERLATFGPNREQVLNALIGIQDFRKSDLCDQLAMPKSDFDEFWKFLMGEQFISRASNGCYRKSGPFNEFLNALIYNLDVNETDVEHPPF